MPVDFLLERVKNSHPRIRTNSGTCDGHFLSEYRMRRSKMTGKKAKIETHEIFFYCRTAGVVQYGLSRNLLRDERHTSTKNLPRQCVLTKIIPRKRLNG